MDSLLLGGRVTVRNRMNEKSQKDLREEEGNSTERVERIQNQKENSVIFACLTLPFFSLIYPQSAHKILHLGISYLVPQPSSQSLNFWKLSNHITLLSCCSWICWLTLRLALLNWHPWQSLSSLTILPYLFGWWLLFSFVLFPLIPLTISREFGCNNDLFTNFGNSIFWSLLKLVRPY